MPGVCLSVCPLATLRKNYWTELHENFTLVPMLTVKQRGGTP